MTAPVSAGTMGPLLVIDDNPLDCEAVRRALWSQVEIQTAFTLSDGIAASTRRTPCCVLLDLHLPDAAGPDTLARYLAARPEAPVVVLTGTDDEVLGARVIESGAQDYLPKCQLSPRLLQRIVRHAIERHRMLARERELRAEAYHGQRLEAVGRLAGGVAHDFNNLLTVITSFAELAMEDGTPHESRRRALEQVLMAGRKAAELTNRLLVLARRRVAAAIDVDPSAVIGELSGMIRRIVGPDVETVYCLDEALGTIQLPEAALDQMVLNAVANAADAMPQGGTLTIRSRAATADEIGPREPGLGWITLEIEDTGSGMTEEARDHAFEPFFTTKGDRGNGLGLSTSVAIVSQAGGRARLDSELAVGTRLSLLFPRSSAPASTPVVEPRPEAARSARVRGRLLVVEDQPALLALFRDVLERRGHSVAAACTLEEAVRLAADGGCFDAVVSDVRLPGGSGLDFARRLRAKEPALPIVLISGYLGDDLPEEVLDEATCFLTKPFRSSELTRTVEELLARAAVPAPRERSLRQRRPQDANPAESQLRA